MRQIYEVKVDMLTRGGLAGTKEYIYPVFYFLFSGLATKSANGLASTASLRL